MTGQPTEPRRETVIPNLERYPLTVIGAVWSALEPLSQDERDRVLGNALAPIRTETYRVLVRDQQDHSLAPCNQARARQLVARGHAQWIAYEPPIIRLTRLTCGCGNDAGRPRSAGETQ